MNRTWKVRRTDHSHPDGSRRWDRAYRLLLEWAGVARSQFTRQEDANADRDLCPGLDAPSSQRPND